MMRIPQDWIDRGLIDSYDYFVYETGQIKNDQSRDALIFGLIQRMTVFQQNMPNTDWIFVGHSMGGLVARSIYGAIQQHAPHLQVKVVITMGTPHQGAPVTEVSFSELPGFINVEPLFNDLAIKVEDPTHHIHPLIQYALTVVRPSALRRLDYVEEYLGQLKDELIKWSDASTGVPARDVIGPHGNVIATINNANFPNPPFKRSIIGTEKQFVAVRSSGEILLKKGEELGTLESFNEARDFYKTNRDLWDFSVTALDVQYYICWADPFCDSSDLNSRRLNARSNRSLWAEGSASLDNLDVTWGQMTNAFTTQIHTISTVEIVCPNQGGFGSDIEFLGIEDQNNLDDCYPQLVYQTITVRLPEKTDLIVTPMYAVWSPGQSPNDQNVNFLYDDTEPDGGYNHFEIRRMNRAYTLPDVFERGQITPPMDDVRRWFESDVFPPGGTP
jgi:hypothetical protein